jgi:hypothetical protein
LTVVALGLVVVVALRSIHARCYGLSVVV